MLSLATGWLQLTVKLQPLVGYSHWLVTATGWLQLLKEYNR